MPAEVTDLHYETVARLRQGLYRLFAAGLLPPDAERMEGLTTGAEVLDGVGIEVFAFSGPWEALMARLDAPGELDDLTDEYTRLFLAGIDGPSCPPHESQYVKVAPTCGVATIFSELERQYRRFGLRVSPGVRIPPDHVAVELEALAVLCERESEAWAEEAFEQVAHVLAVESAFLRQHLGRWFPLFARRVEEAAAPGLYRDLATAAAAFVHHDGQLVRLLAREVPQAGVG